MPWPFLPQDTFFPSSAGSMISVSSRELQAKKILLSLVGARH
jgi:hypothetical protein